MASLFSTSASSSTPNFGGVPAVATAFFDESFFDLLEPDILTPVEKPEEQVCNGERRLMAAILVDGVEAYLRYHLDGSTNDPEVSPEELVAWVDQDSQDSTEYDYVFGFDTVCQSLGINPRYLRCGLKRFVRSVAKRRASAESAAAISGEAVAGFVGWKRIRRPRKR